MSDKEIIIKSLERVERRIRTNRLLNELALGATFFLAFPLALKVWGLFDPLRGATIAFIAGIWILRFAAYVVWRSLYRATLRQAAAVIDKAAGLNDEIKTAFWFIHNPRPSEWVDVQIHRASISAKRANLDTFFPRRIPKTSYVAAGLFLLFAGLNFVPLPWNHNWLALQAAPAFAPTPDEAAILKQTEALLRKAEKLKQPELAKKLEEIVQQLQEGKIDAAQAAQMLDLLQSLLDEGNLDTASIREGLEEMARDLAESDKLEPTAEAMKNKELNLAADELRKLAEKLGLNTPESNKQMQKSLQQASENPRLGLEELAKLLKEAAENLKNEDQQGAPMPGNSEGNGLMPSGKGGSDAPREGAATTLDVKLQQERVKGMQDQGKEEDLEEVSKQERSKLDYRNVKSELSPAQKDLLNQDRIPWEYRPLIKNYFQAIRPPVKK